MAGYSVRSPDAPNAWSAGEEGLEIAFSTERAGSLGRRTGISEPLFSRRAWKYITLPGDDKIPPTAIGDDDLGHMTNWFECLRSRQQPRALCLKPWWW
jgi:hypothetical protein